MPRRIKIVHIVGTRPEFVQLEPVSRQARREADEVLVHTGQHYDYAMSALFFRQLDLPEPRYHLGVGSDGHGAQTGNMLIRLDEVLLREHPDCVLVYGDTNSTLAGALAAVKLHIPIGHVEAGLRSYNRSMPEEINRVVADHVSDFRFCPTQAAVKNLEAEGIVDRTYWTGDVMFDSLLQHRQEAEQVSPLLSELGLEPNRYCLATVHRAENTDQPDHLRQIVSALTAISHRVPVVLPLHPRTAKRLREAGIDAAGERLAIVEPVSYVDMLSLENHALVILTDSGGVQKQAFMLGVPCITLREETEWVETLQGERNVLVGASRDRTVAAFDRMLALSGSREIPGCYGAGQAAQEILKVLGQELG